MAFFNAMKGDAMSKTKTYLNRVWATLLTVLMILAALMPAFTTNAYAASTVKKITIKFSHTITYGSGEGGYTNLKVTDLNDSMGSRPVLCMQPSVASPPDGTYTVDKTITDDGTGKWNCIRNLVYYTPGYPGYKDVKDTWFDGYSKDEAIAVMHMAVSYAYAGRPENLSTWGGNSTSSLPNRIWGKAKTVADNLWKDSGEKDENVPEGFKALFVSIGDYQNMVCGYLNDGKLKLTKEFKNEDVYKDNECYNRAGIVFTVYDVDNDKEVGKFTTNADGSVTPGEIELPEGTYKVVESHTKSGFTGNGDSKVVEVAAGATATVSFSDTPITDPIRVVLNKADLEIGQEFPQGAATLAGAEYTIRYYDGQYSTVSAAEESGEPTRSWVFKTDEKGYIYFDDESYMVSGDPQYHTNSGRVTLPLGTVLIQETKAPVGYLIDNNIYLRNITDNENEMVEDVQTFNQPLSSDQVKRGDLLFIKSSEGKERMAGIPFKITSKTTGENHIVITDENGYVNTSSAWNLHSQNTNRGEDATDGVWFGTDSNGNVAKVDDKLGALPFDTYIIEEQRCEANKNHELVTVQAVIKRDKVTVDLGTIDDPIAKEPEIHTSAVDSDTKNHIALADSKITIIDTVTYKDFTKGQSYKVVGRLMDKATGKPVLVDGKEVTSETTFTAEDDNGSVDVKFVFDGSKLGGTSVVVFEKAYDNEYDAIVAIHEDITDENQEVKIPEIGTKATTTDGKTNIVKPEKDQTIVDTVSYKNLIPGKEYKLVTWLVNNHGSKIKDTTVNTKFTAKTADGEVKATIKFDASKFGGETLTVFEEVYLDGKIVGIHKDVNDKDQMIKIEHPFNPPQTGDHTDMMLWVGLAAAAFAAGIGLAVCKRKNAEKTE